MVKPHDQPVVDGDTKERILRAAGDLIVERGWPKVTTRAIAERAGVNNALIHYHFGTKDDLLFEAAGMIFASEISGPLQAMADAQDVGVALRGIFDWLRDVDAYSPMMIISMEVAHQAVRDERARAWIASLWQSYFDLFATMIAAAQERGEFIDSIDARGAAVTIGALLDGLFLYRLVDPNLAVANVADAIDGLIDLMTKGVS